MRTSFPQALLVSAVLCCAFWSKGVEGCHTLQIFSQHFTTQTFERLPIDRYPSSTGRPSYVSVPENAEDHPVYLYHAVHEESGIGQWIINDVWNDPEHALSFINSWSILPHLITSVHDSPSTFVSWQYGLPQGGWESDRTVAIRCMDELDTTVFLDSSVQLAPLLTGFYVEQHVSEDYADIYDGPVYSQISRYVQRPEEEVFMFIIHADDEEKKYRWMIGHEIGVDAGIAFISDAPRQAYLIPHEAQWHFSTVDSEHPWLIDLSAKLYSQALYYQTHEIPAHGPRDIFRVMHYIRSATVSDNNTVIELRNKIPMPKIGLGTGGLFHEESPRVFREAIDAGYRLFDMAREYGNEHIMGNLLQDLLNEKNPIQRKDLFLETKVWPTELGFLPTSQAIDASLNEYHTNYIDLYMLHWPECNPSIDWMHCETTVDPQGTWRESWKALEKAYAEGRLLSIGVSNFNEELLEEALDHGSVLPHVVQNFAEVRKVDEAVRELCQKNLIVYQPYASVRNLQFLSDDIKQYTAQLAKKYKVSEHSVSLRFFLQSGASIIPRSSKLHHLKENLQVLNWSLSEDEMRALGWTLTPPLQDEEEPEL